MLSIGTNDAAPWKRVPEALFRDTLGQFLSSCGPERWVIILPPGVIEARLTGRGDRTNALLEDYRAAAAAAAAGVGAMVMDPKSMLSAFGSSAFASDGVHLSGEGYRVLVPALRAAIGSDT